MNEIRSAPVAALLCLILTLVIFSGCERRTDRPPVTIHAVGDIMMGNYLSGKGLPGSDGALLFEKVSAHLGGAHVLLGNLEGPLTDTCGREKCLETTEGDCFQFATPALYATHLARASFNVMAVANNHALDCGLEGLRQTLAALEGAGISPAGGKFVARPRAGRTTVAVAGFSYLPAPHSHSILDLERAAAVVKQLKEGHDIVVVSFHGGTEGRGALYVEDHEEEFLGEKRGNVMRFARAVVDAGADLVIGHGPHVPRAIEIYRGRLIAYSLGNFLVYGGFNTRGYSGITAILKVRLNGNTGEFMDGRLVPVRLDGKGIPAPDPQGGAIALTRRLVSRLAQEPGLTITDDGTITPTTRAPRTAR